MEIYSSSFYLLVFFSILLAFVNGEVIVNQSTPKVKNETTNSKLTWKEQTETHNETMTNISQSSQSESISEEAKKLADKIKLALMKVSPRKLTIEEEIKKMKNHLKEIAPKCETKSECPAETCCLITEKEEGRCVILPHRENQVCSDLCQCREGYSCKTPSHDTPKVHEVGVCKLDGKIVGQKGAGYIPKLLLKIKEIQRKHSNLTIT